VSVNVGRDFNDLEQRRLAAIVALDVVGYSRAIAQDEKSTLGRVRELRKTLIEPEAARFGGRLVKTMGDGFLIEFGSAVQAVRYTVGIQQSLADPRYGLQMRAGVNLGDVVVEDGDLFGDGVNIAARLESAAPMGGIAMSDVVRAALIGRLDLALQDAGLVTLKNIDRPVHVWHWLPIPSSGSSIPVTTSPEPSSPVGLSLPDNPSIVVLPFDSLSQDPEVGHLADGVVESITAVLSRIRSFFVISRNSAFTFKGKHRIVREIGRDLGVAYVLEGSVQKAGQRLRITVQLIDAIEDRHMWAERYDGTLDEIFDMQDRITEQVSCALQPSIRYAEIERARRKRPQDMRAYDYTMRAMQHVWLLEHQETTRALELLENALRCDPEYPVALALSAWCWAQRGAYNWVPDVRGAKARSLELATRAANWSSDDPLVLTVLGTVQTLARQYGIARDLLQRATSLDPNSAWAISRLAWLYTYCGELEKAIPEFERSQRLSPLDPHRFNNLVGMGFAWQLQSDDSKAELLFRQALEQQPKALWIHRNLAPALWGIGNYEAAMASLRIWTGQVPDFTTEQYESAMAIEPRFLTRIVQQLHEMGVPSTRQD